MKKSQLRQLIREAIKETYGSFNDDEHRSKDERSKFLARNSKVNYGFRDYDSDDPRMLGKEEYLSQMLMKALQGLISINRLKKKHLQLVGIAMKKMQMLRMLLIDSQHNKMPLKKNRNHMLPVVGQIL
jgi:hypothetical protein